MLLQSQGHHTPQTCCPGERSRVCRTRYMSTHRRPLSGHLRALPGAGHESSGQVRRHGCGGRLRRSRGTGEVIKVAKVRFHMSCSILGRVYGARNWLHSIIAGALIEEHGVLISVSPASAMTRGLCSNEEKQQNGKSEHPEHTKCR